MGWSAMAQLILNMILCLLWIQLEDLKTSKIVVSMNLNSPNPSWMTYIWILWSICAELFGLLCIC